MYRSTIPNAHQPGIGRFFYCYQVISGWLDFYAPGRVSKSNTLTMMLIPNCLLLTDQAATRTAVSGVSVLFFILLSIYSAIFSLREFARKEDDQ